MSLNRVILVDDDPIVLVQLRKIIDWNKLNCELVAEAANGEDAIRAIEQFDPQLVITDISMPGITGVDLIQYINKKEKKTKVIAISAFDHFNYVRESLKFGADDYLLKHQLTAEQLEEVIRSALSDMGESGEKRHKGMSLQERKEQLFYRILHAGLRESDIQMLEELSLGWIKGKMILALGCIEEHTEENDNTAYVFMDETIKYYQDYQILPLDKDLYLILFCADEERREEIPVVIEQIRTNLKRFCDADISFGVSGIVDGYREIRKTIDYCQRQMENQRETSSYSEVVRQAVLYIKENYKEKISLSDLAEKFSVSSSYLSRSFKKETGIGLVSYINQIRMEQAKKMIQEGVLSLNEIAYEIGICNYNYFYMMFKETYGITPSDYTKKKTDTEE